MARPIRIVQVRPGQRAQVRATCGNDAVHVTITLNVADRDRRNFRFNADKLAERRLVQAPVHRLARRIRLAR